MRTSLLLAVLVALAAGGPRAQSSSSPSPAPSPGAARTEQALAAEDRIARDTWLPQAQQTRADRVAWWRESRFGLFIHWGVYSALAGEWEGSPVTGYAEHIMRIRRIPRAVYQEKVAAPFNPTAFDADEWVALLKRAGMRYLVITAKHHDGFAMYDSQVSPYNIVRATAFERDPMRELREACRRAGVRFGFYYSHAFDWEDPDAPGNDWDYDNPAGDKQLHGGLRWYDDHPELVEQARRYVDRKAIPQVKELLTRYHPDLMWFDTPSKLPPAENLRILTALRQTDPRVIVNSRIIQNVDDRFGGYYHYADYLSTADRPAEFRWTEGDWEGIPTTNESYGYHKGDRSHKPAAHFVQLLAKAAARGGNLMMNLGPMGDGRVDPTDVTILEGIGAWLQANGESIYGTTRSPLGVQPWGEITRKGNRLYLHVFNWPDGEMTGAATRSATAQLLVAGLRTPVRKAWLLTDPEQRPLAVTKQGAEDVEIALPSTVAAPAPGPPAGASTPVRYAGPSASGSSAAASTAAGSTTRPATTERADRVIVLELAGEPNSDRAVLLRGGETTLHVFDGDAARGVRFGDGKRTRDTTVGWDDSSSTITWSLRLTAPARVTIDAEYASGEKDGGAFEIRVGEQPLAATVAPGVGAPANAPISTPSAFERKPVGVVTLPAGRHTLTLAPTRIDGALMRLRSLRLSSTPTTQASARTPVLTMTQLVKSASRVVPADPAAPADALSALVIARNCRGTRCAPSVKNTGKQPVRVKEIVLFSLPHALPPDTRLYGEGFQMLSQIGGTLAKPQDLGYSEVKHYKMPQPTDAAVASGLLTLTPPGGDTLLFGFTSSHRFIGRFYARPTSLDIIVDTEGLTLAPGETWKLEQFMFATGAARPVLLDALAREIARNHPPLKQRAPVSAPGTASAPTGWCSWYCFGPRVTAQQVLDNLDTIAREIPRLRYVQIDDGYQAAMGDWLDTGKAFGGDVIGVLKQIRARGFEPAIWVAPFIAEADSQLFKTHPDWFIKGEDGRPLPSNTVTFGGWRHGPWYALDGTHPEVQQHFERVFRTMREQWGVTYFKLDANFWGAMHGGRFHDPKATRIEAYRRGMAAILRGSADSFILGCNHPIWPSFGLIHGSRSSEDIKRAWNKIKQVALQNLNRNWQNGRLWWNDPDAVVLTGELSEDEVRFHATATYASGGMILSGDDLTRMPAERMGMLQKLLPPTGTAATFEDDALRVGVMLRGTTREYAVFNWEDQPQTIAVKLPAACTVTDVWSGESLGRQEGTLTLRDMPPHSARLLACRAN